MKPLLKRGQRVATLSRLYENQYLGAFSAPAGAIGTVVDIEGCFYYGYHVHMVATVRVTVGTETFFVRVNERALKVLD